MSTVNTQDVPACPLISLPNTAPLRILSPNISHCTLVNVLKSLMPSNLLEKPTPSHFLSLAQELLLSRKFPFSPVLQNGCCYCPFFEDEEKTLRGCRTPLRSRPGHQRKSEPSRCLLVAFFPLHRKNCIGAAPGWQALLALKGQGWGPCATPRSPCGHVRKGPGGELLTWSVEQPRPLAVVGHLLLAVLGAVDHCPQLLQAAPVVQGHGVGLLRVGASHTGQFCVVVLHQRPDLVLCPENTTQARSKDNHAYRPPKNWKNETGLCEQCDVWRLQAHQLIATGALYSW